MVNLFENCPVYYSSSFRANAVYPTNIWCDTVSSAIHWHWLFSANYRVDVCYRLNTGFALLVLITYLGQILRVLPTPSKKVSFSCSTFSSVGAWILMAFIFRNTIAFSFEAYSSMFTSLAVSKHTVIYRINRPFPGNQSLLKIVTSALYWDSILASCLAAPILHREHMCQEKIGRSFVCFPCRFRLFRIYSARGSLHLVFCARWQPYRPFNHLLQLLFCTGST